MRARANAAVIHRAACANGAYMRTRMHAAITDAGAGTHDRAGMATRGDAMAIDARARADMADMRARAHTVAADMRTYAHAQDIDVRADGISRSRREKCEDDYGRSERFHLVILWIDPWDNVWLPLKVHRIARSERTSRYAAK
jgi:hypothetical protein